MSLTATNRTAPPAYRAEPRSISIRDALVRYGIGRTKMYELLGNGFIRARKFGAKTLIDVESADAFFASLPSFGAE